MGRGSLNSVYIEERGELLNGQKEGLAEKVADIPRASLIAFLPLLQG